MFVYSGILPICKGDDGVAAVLGHEIAHNIASHAEEGMSRSLLVRGIVYALISLDITQFFGSILAQYALDLGITKPASRKQESEADYIGLMMMTRACYDPHAAVRFWGRMQKADEQERETPQFLSTHPSVSVHRF